MFLQGLLAAYVKPRAVQIEIPKPQVDQFRDPQTMAPGHQHHGMVAPAGTAGASGVEQALHLRFGEEVLAAAIDGLISRFGTPFRGHSLPYRSWLRVIQVSKVPDFLAAEAVTYYRRDIS